MRQSIIFFFALIISCNEYQEKEFYELPKGDQGINESEEEVFEQSIEVLLENSSIDMVFTKRNDQYEVIAKRGRITFERIIKDNEYQYQVVTQKGENPIENQSVETISTLEEELAQAKNPNNVTFDTKVKLYEDNAKELVFHEYDAVSYPFAYERIAALFDHYATGDMFVLRVPHSFKFEADNGSVAQHGGMDITQSRSPLIFSGKGVKHNAVTKTIARQVDISPTIAKLMNLKKTDGINSIGKFSSDVYLKWQDGKTLDEVAQGDTPEYAMILMYDGLSATELYYHLFDNPDLDKYPNFLWLKENGITFQYGAISNFPANTYPGHHAVCTGAYSGHHGIIDNHYFMRLKEYDKLLEKKPIEDFTNAGDIIDGDMIETIYEAVHRSFDNWHPTKNPLGNFTASLNDPCGKGADYAFLETYLPYYAATFKKVSSTAPNFPPIETGINLVDESVRWENIALGALWLLYVDGPKQGLNPIPRFSIFQNSITDTIGHHSGPHTNILRDVLTVVDQRLGLAFDALKTAGIFEKTLFIVTSDHAMALQDPTRAVDPRDILAFNGIKFEGTSEGMIYFKTLGYNVEQNEDNFIITIFDEDNDKPISDVSVTVLKSDKTEKEYTADENGKITIKDFKKGTKIGLSLKHKDFNPRNATVVL